MANFMTLEEFHKKLGEFIVRNPEIKNKLVCDSAVAQWEGDYKECEPGCVIFTLGTYADDDKFEKEGELTIRPPNVNKYVM